MGSLHSGRSISAHLAEDVQQLNTTSGSLASFNAIAKMCMQFLCTVEFKELLLAWMCAVLESGAQ